MQRWAIIGILLTFAAPRPVDARLFQTYPSFAFCPVGVTP